jgi:hypothetical protein
MFKSGDRACALVLPEQRPGEAQWSRRILWLPGHHRFERGDDGWPVFEGGRLIRQCSLGSNKAGRQRNGSPESRESVNSIATAGMKHPELCIRRSVCRIELDDSKQLGLNPA